MINLFRKYLLTIHRALSRNIDNAIETANKTIVIVGLSTIFFLIWVESFTELQLINGRFSVIKFGIPILVLFLPILFWYHKHLPTEKELVEGKDQYTGVILFFISMILVAFFRN